MHDGTVTVPSWFLGAVWARLWGRIWEFGICGMARVYLTAKAQSLEFYFCCIIEYGLYLNAAKFSVLLCLCVIEFGSVFAGITVYR